MRTVSENIAALAEEIEESLARLMESSSLEDVNDDDGPIFLGAHHAWQELDLETRRLKSKLLTEYDHFIALIRALLREQSDDVRSQIETDDDVIRQIIGQTRRTWHSTPQEALASAKRSLEAMLNFVSELYDSSEGVLMLVPDTNALLYNPFLEQWRFEGSVTFTVILLPTVLKELDALKISHRNPDVRAKAESLIRRIKEYRRRGRLTEGVTLVNKVSTLRAVAQEPSVGQSLPWLDASNDDDRLLASFIEIMRQHPRSAVILLTRDLNLQNKAEFARVAFGEPPELDTGEGEFVAHNTVAAQDG